MLYRFSSNENNAFTWPCSSLGFAGGADAAGVVGAGDCGFAPSSGTGVMGCRPNGLP